MYEIYREGVLEKIYMEKKRDEFNTSIFIVDGKEVSPYRRHRKRSKTEIKSLAGLNFPNDKQFRNDFTSSVLD